MKTFVLTTGLTQRLIVAHDATEAQRKFVQFLTYSDLAVFARRFTPAPGEILIREATDEDLERFKPHRRKPLHESQQAWDMQ